MPRPADPAMRGKLIDAAARLVVSGQPLSLRRLASEVGTSTMAVYTYFGGLSELTREVRLEGFRRLGEHLAAVPVGRDPVADLVALGWGYCLNALENPDLYRVMFFETTSNIADAAAGAVTFLPVVNALERAIERGRVHCEGAWDPAVQMWSLTHGAVSLTIGGMLTAEDLLHHLEGGVRAFLVGLGDEPARADRS